jgi:hypothetical protein
VGDAVTIVFVFYWPPILRAPEFGSRLIAADLELPISTLIDLPAFCQNE